MTHTIQRGRMVSRTLLLVCAAPAALLWAQAATAADAAAPATAAAAAASTATALEEVIVTARKREENIQIWQFGPHHQRDGCRRTVPLLQARLGQQRPGKAMGEIICHNSLSILPTPRYTYCMLLF